MKSAEYWIKHLNLTSHPEGGYYDQVLKANQSITLEGQSPRALYTSIYFLLTAENPSRFHRLTGDEIWYFHEGDSLTVHLITPAGDYEVIKLGKNPEAGEELQAVFPKGTIFGSTVEEGYALVSCMVAPGFEYQDFELFKRDTLLAIYPEYEAIIRDLTHN